MDPGVLIVAGAAPTSLLLASRRGPGVFMVAMCALVPFPLAIAGEAMFVNVSPVDLFAAVMAIYVLFFNARSGRRLTLGPVGVPLAIFLLINVISSLMLTPGLDSAMCLARMVLGTLAAVLIFANLDPRIKTLEHCLEWYLVGTTVLSVFSMLAFLHGGFTASEYTLDIHKNSLGPIFGTGIVIAMTSMLTSESHDPRRRWWLFSLACASLGITFSLSRGGWISTAAALTFILLATRRFKAFGISLIALAPVVVAVWYLLPEKAVDYATNISTDSYQISSRLDTIDVVLKAFQTNPLFGVGVGLRKVVEPHNVVVLTLGETGMIGLTAFLATIVAGFYSFHLALRNSGKDVARRRVVIAGTAVFLLTTVAGMMDVYWRRGVGFMAWAGVGMAANIIRLPQPVEQRVPHQRPPRRNLRVGLARGVPR